MRVYNLVVYSWMYLYFCSYLQITITVIRVSTVKITRCDMFWMHLFGCRTCVAFAFSLNISYRQVVLLMGVLANILYLHSNIRICIWTSVFVSECSLKSGGCLLWALVMSDTVLVRTPLTFPAYGPGTRGWWMPWQKCICIFSFTFSAHWPVVHDGVCPGPGHTSSCTTGFLTKGRLVLAKSDCCFNIGEYSSTDYLDSSWNEGIPWQRWHFPPFW